MDDKDASLVRRSLPHSVRVQLEARGISFDKVIVSTDSDLDIAGEYSESWLIVTKGSIFVFALDGHESALTLSNETPLSVVETARMDTRVGSSFLEVKKNGSFEEILRFSNKNADKFAKAVGRIKALSQGRDIDVATAEEVIEGRCQKCGARVPERRMRLCPKCIKRGQVFLRFLGKTRSYWPYTATAMVLVVLTILISLVPAQLQRVLLDNVFGQRPLPSWFAAITRFFNMPKPTQWLWLLVGGLAITTALAAVIGWMRERLAVWINNRLGYDLRKEVFATLEDLAVRYHDIHPVGQLMTRCSQDVEALQGFINQLTSGFGFQIVQVIAVALVMLLTNPWLTLFAVFPAPFVMIFTVFFYRHIVPEWQKYWTTRSNLSNSLHGSLNGIRVVKAFAQEAREAKRFDRYSAKFRDSGYSVGNANAWFYPMMGWVFQLGSYFIWLSGGWAVLHHLDPAKTPELTVGTVILFLNYLGMFYGPLNSLTQMSTWFTQFTTQAHRVFEVLDEDPEILEDDSALDVEIMGAIAFENVTFGYDPHIPVLHDVSFRVEPGQMLGIVGHSGSGKSTAVNLIMRFYDVQEGRVTIDNTDIRSLRKLCLRRQVGLVAQDPFLFRGSVADNIAYGNPDVAPESILNAALAANAHMFITRIHDGYDTRLGEHGSGLSGGERQRVAIARALLQNPRVLILDEATSSVDAIAEREIQKALEALSQGRTTIAIAHRLSTLRNCDRILVFEEGNIREQGSHDELMAIGGIYKKLVDIQTQLSGGGQQSVDGLAALKELEKAEDGKVQNADRTRLEAPHIRYLDPKELRISSLPGGWMRVAHKSDVFVGVRAYRCFPISRPSEFIALWTGSSALEHEEVGMVRNIHDLDEESLETVEFELAKRYFIHYVKRINFIKEDIGFLTWDVDTDKGPMVFLMKRWERNAVIETTGNGRIVLDLDFNRYEIEDIDALDADSRETFLRYIYW